MQQRAPGTRHDAPAADTVTGAHLTALQDALRACAEGQPAALFVLRVDDLATVNANLGYRAGDRVVAAVADTLRGWVRPQDRVVPLANHRWAVLAPGLQNSEFAHLAVNKLQRLLDQHPLAHGHGLRLAVTVGVALGSGPGCAEAMLLAAEQARRDASANGDTWALAHTDGSNAVRNPLLLHLEDAVRENEFELWYQPKVRLADHRVVGAEGLCRWRRPGGGLIAPGEFIPLLEARPTTMRRLTLQLLKFACREAMAWQQDLAVAVNATPDLVRDPALVTAVADTLALFGLPAERLTIEVTEGGLVRDVDRVLGILGDLRRLGVRIAIDDFGTGYASLAQFKRVPADELKIDRCFVEHVASDRDDQRLVRTMVALARDFGMHTVAEGVEDAATLEVLTDLGCDIAQGFHIARPMPHGDFQQWLAPARDG